MSSLNRVCRSRSAPKRGDSMPQPADPVKEPRTVWQRELSLLLAARTLFCSLGGRVIFGDCSGAVAQLGERCVRNAEVEGSTPFRSTATPLATRVASLALDCVERD